MPSEATDRRWTLDRRLEVDALEKLLRKITGLDNCTSFIRRAGECMEEADKLLNTDRDLRRSSFVQFLTDLIMEEKDNAK